jgi:hypothetical protein
MVPRQITDGNVLKELENMVCKNENRKESARLHRVRTRDISKKKKKKKGYQSKGIPTDRPLIFRGFLLFSPIFCFFLHKTLIIHIATPAKDTVNQRHNYRQVCACGVHMEVWRVNIELTQNIVF